MRGCSTPCVEGATAVGCLSAPRLACSAGGSGAKPLGSVPGVGQFVDVVDEAEELPLPVDLRPPAEGEAREPLVVAQVREDRFHGREAAPVLRPALGGSEAPLHLPREALGAPGRRPVEAHHLPRGGPLGRAQAPRAMRARHAVALRALERRPAIAPDHLVLPLPIERLPRRTHARVYRITHSYALAITQIYAPDLARCGA